jgi:uncharacterized membrane protein YphA (DoxX/SURF4 family)
MKTILSWILRLGLGGLFLFAGVSKLGDPTQFAIEIGNYRLLEPIAPWLAVILPFIEIVLGVVLIAGPRPWRRASALALLGLLAVFTVAVVTVVARGINVDCGCFGGQSGPVTWTTVIRDVTLLLVSSVILILERGNPLRKGVPTD